MRLPSHPRARVSRGLVLRAALGALLAALVAAAGRRCRARAPRAIAASSSPRASAARSSPAAAVSAYGVVFSGASLVVADYSATHDMRVDSPVVRDHERRRLAHVRAGRRHEEHGLPHLGHALPRDRHGLEHVQRRRRLRHACRCAARARSASTACARAGTARPTILGKVPEGRQEALPARPDRRAAAGRHAARRRPTCRPPPDDDGALRQLIARRCGRGASLE